MMLMMMGAWELSGSLLLERFLLCNEGAVFGPRQELACSGIVTTGVNMETEHVRLHVYKRYMSSTCASSFLTPCTIMTNLSVRCRSRASLYFAIDLSRQAASAPEQTSRKSRSARHLCEVQTFSPSCLGISWSFVSLRVVFSEPTIMYKEALGFDHEVGVWHRLTWSGLWKTPLCSYPRL